MSSVKVVKMLCKLLLVGEVEMLHRNNYIERQTTPEHDCTLIIPWEDLSEHDKRRQPQTLHLATDN